MFSVGHNLPGYLPESDPDAFEDWADARDALGDLLRETVEEMSDEDRLLRKAEIEHWQFWIPMATESDGNQVYYLDGRAYWLERIS